MRPQLAPLFLVTGATGFLGSEIVACLQTAQLAVRTCGRSTPPLVGLPDYHVVDLVRQQDLASILRGVTCVIHAAGLAHQFRLSRDVEAALFAVNVQATERLLRASIDTGVEQFVYVSSCSVYGIRSATALTEHAPCAPLDAYGASKYEGEQRTRRLALATKLQATILRLPTIYGDGDPGNVARLIRAIDTGRFLWIGTGENTKNLLHRDDAARACMLAAMRHHGGQVEVYNVASPPCRMRDAVDILAAALGRRPPRWHIPARPALYAARVASVLLRRSGRLGGIHDTIRKWLYHGPYDGTKFAREFDFEPHISLAEGLNREVAWYRDVSRFPARQQRSD